MDLGVQKNGKRERRFFKREADATSFANSYKGDQTPLGVLFDRKSEILSCYERLREVDATFTDATNFFILHGARKGNPAIGAVVERLLEEKEQAGRKPKYLTNLNKTFDAFTKYVKSGTRIGDIDSEKVNRFVYKRHQRLSAVTKLNLIRNLAVLFRFGIKKKYIGINPVGEIDRPEIKFSVPNVISPDDFKKLLDCCLRKEWHDRLTVFVLVGFCGVRMEEASQLRWDDIDFVNKKVMIPAHVAKKGSYRRNVIQPNAMMWLEAIRDDRRKDFIIKNGWEHLLRSAVKAAKITYTKNCIRHSFCSYALEAEWSLAEAFRIKTIRRSCCARSRRSAERMARRESPRDASSCCGGHYADSRTRIVGRS